MYSPGFTGVCARDGNVTTSAAHVHMRLPGIFPRGGSITLLLLEKEKRWMAKENENVEMDAPPRDGNVTLTLHSHIRDGNVTLSCCASHRRD